MRRGPARALHVATAFIGIGALTLLLWEPHIEGRNAHATLTEIYFGDPFLAYVYVGSIPFFIATHQAFRLLGLVGSGDGEASDRAARAARLVRNGAGITILFIVVGVAILMFVGEERPPAVFMGVLATLPVLLIGAPATAYERTLRCALD
jgi:hypothetical protein